MRSGLLVTPINWHLSAEEAGYIVEDCGAAGARGVGVLCRRRGRRGRRWPDGAASRSAEPIDGVRRRTRRPSAPQPTTPVADECEGNWMFYSSGTTGRPEGHQAAERRRPDRRADRRSRCWCRACTAAASRRRYLSPSPLYHAAPSGWAHAVHRLGGTVVVDEAVRPDRVPRGRSSVTASPWPRWCPTHLVRLLKLPERRADPLRPVEPARSSSTPRRRARPRSSGPTSSGSGPIVHEYYSGQRGRRVLRHRARGVARPSRLGRALAVMGAVHIVDDDGKELPPGDRGPGVVRGTEPLRVPRRSREDRGGVRRSGVGHARRDRSGRRATATSTSPTACRT